MKSTMNLFWCLFFLFTQSFFISQQVTASEQGYRNYYGMAGNTKPDGDIKYARQMGYEYIAINPSVSPKEYHRNTECAGLKFYLVNPHFYPQVLAGYERDIDITKPVSEAAKEYYNQRMVWRSNDPFPHNLATGYQHAGDAEKISVIWDFQQQAVIDEVVEQIIRLAKSYEDEGLPFTFGGYIMDEPRLEGEFYRLDEKGKNIPVGLSYWTGTDSGLVHDTITHEYATYSDGKVAFYRQLRARLAEEFENPRWIVQPSVLYSEVDTDEWIYQIKDRADKDALTPDMLSQKHGGHADFVDEEKNFNSGVDITKDAVGISQSGEADEYKNRLFAAKAGIHGAWYNWCGDGMPEFHDISEIHPRLKLIRCLPNWDNLNKVTLPDRAWDGSVYRSTKSYASGDVMYSRHPVTEKLFAVFLTLSGAITLNAGETVTTVQRANSHFIESGDGKNDVSIVGNEIRLKSKDDLGKGYIVTVSTDVDRSGGSQSTVATNSEPDRTSGSEASRGGENNNGLSDMAWVESVSSKKRNKKDIGTKATLAQQAVSSHIWQQVPIRTSAQKAAGLSGGEGWQMIFDISYASSNPNVVYFVTDTTQVWKSTDGGISWQRKGGDYPAQGGASIVVDPNNENIVYVAGSVMGWWSCVADHIEGIIRSTDGGNTWTLVKKAHFHRSHSNGKKLAFAGSTIYAAPATGGILKSTNGTTWNLLNKSGGGYILDTLNLNNIVVHPTDNTILFVSATDGLYKIVDSGSSATVTKIGTGLPVGAVYQLQIDPRTPNTMYIAAGSKGVYRSTDGGLNFSARNNGLSNPISLGGTACFLVMSPVNSNRLIVTFKEIFGKHLYYTNDGGASWTQTANMDEQNAYGWISGSLFGWTNNLSGIDNGTPSIAFHPANQDIALVAGWGNQIKRTTDGGVTWKYSNTGYSGASAGTQMSATPIAWDRNNSKRAVFSHTDFGSLITTNNEDTFTAIMDVTWKGKKASHAVAMLDDIVVQSVGQWDSSVVVISRSSGTSWAIVSGTEDADYKAIFAHPQNSNIVYAQKFKFTNIQTSNTFTTLTRPILEIFKGDGNIVYSHSGSTIYKSIDQGNTWTNPYPPLNLTNGFSISQIAIDPTDQDRIYVAVKGKGVYIINNTVAKGGTAILKNAENGIAKDQFGGINILAVTVDPNNSNIVYAGAFAGWAGKSNGVFRSLDKGNTWVNINGNLGAYLNIHNLTVNPFDSFVYLNGPTGTWKLPPPSSTSSVDIIAPQCSVSINSNATYTNSTTVTLTLSATDNVGVTGYYLSMSSTKPLASATNWTPITSTPNYTESVSYTLSSEDGKKTVYVWYKDASGNVSNTVSDSITLDTTVPKVTINNPKSNVIYTTTSNTLNLEGNASDSTSGVTGVSWSNDKGGNGMATGTTSWSISGISLTTGENTITVTATDGASNSGSATITVNYIAGTVSTVTTGLATNITLNSVTLNGTVKANGLITTIWFEYGMSSGSYENKSSTQSINGSSDTTVSIVINGLLEGETYYYRIVGKNSAGITCGNEMSFMTLSSTTTNNSSSVQALYAFDEGNGTTATDSSGNGRHGTVSGATWTTGKFAGALNFNGASNYVSVPSLNYDEISVSAWFYRNSVDTVDPDTIFGGWSWSNVQGYGLYFDQYGSTKNTIRFIVTSKTSAGTKTQKYAIKDLITSTGKWFHVVGTYNKTTGEQKLYVDGQLVNTQTHPAGNTIVPYTATSNMAIGTLSWNYGHMNGKVDEVHVYNRALSAGDVLSLFNDGTGSDMIPPIVSATNPVSGGVNIAVGNAITATFSEAMTSATINNTTFTISGVTGTVSYSGMTATFTPSGPLAYSTTYTATITTGVTDVAGNPMAANYTWSFTTEASNGIGGQQAYYTFDEGTGSTTADSSGNSRNGTINGATWTTGKFGGALNFNGTSNYVSTPSLNYDEISVSAWFYRNSVDTVDPDTIYGGWSWNAGGEGYGLYFDQYSSTKNTIRFIVTSKTSGGTKTQKYAIKDLITSTDKWFHVAGTYNKTTGEQKLYVDGQLVNTQIHPAGNTVVPYTATSNMAIGTLSWNYGHMDGKVDDVQVYNRALNDQEILDLYYGNSL
ncbi:conserved hypothetical protein [Candidatus Brocadia pituitae]|nr:conserved hypothetical protein [Candidatus Brocadia pituitae]